jgi:hypothetical protein
MIVITAIFFTNKQDERSTYIIMMRDN